MSLAFAKKLGKRFLKEILITRQGNLRGPSGYLKVSERAVSLTESNNRNVS